MPFDIQYGPISTAMGLAQQAGRNQAMNTGFGQDMDLLNYMQRAQQMANQQRATEVSEAMQGQGLDLESQRAKAQQNLAQQQLAATTQYRNNSLEGLNEYRQGRNDIGQQNADTKAAGQQSTADFQQGRLGISQQNADTNQQFKESLIPIQQQNAASRQQGVNTQGQVADTRQDAASVDALKTEANALQNFVNKHESNFGDPNDQGYMQAKARLMQVQQQMAQHNQTLPPPPNHPVVQGRGGGRGPGNASPPGSTPATAVHVTSQQEYAQLPPGTYYVDSNGTLAQKR